MKFLVDANLSPRVARLIVDAGHDAIHVSEIGMLAADDPAILDRAADDDRVILSADADFGALLAIGGHSKPSFILLRSADHMTPEGQAGLVLANLAAVDDDLGQGAVVTFARGRLRVRPLPIDRNE